MKDYRCVYFGRAADIFAHELEQVLNELANEGYDYVNVMQVSEKGFLLIAKWEGERP